MSSLSSNKPDRCFYYIHCYVIFIVETPLILPPLIRMGALWQTRFNLVIGNGHCCNKGPIVLRQKQPAAPARRPRSALATAARRMPANIHANNTTPHTDSDMSVTINRTYLNLQQVYYVHIWMSNCMALQYYDCQRNRLIINIHSIIQQSHYDLRYTIVKCGCIYMNYIC